MSTDGQESSPLEQILAEYLDSSGSVRPDLRQLLRDRPEVASQMRQLLDDHDRAAAAQQPTFLEDLVSPSVEHVTPPSTSHFDAPTLPPAPRLAVPPPSPSDTGLEADDPEPSRDGTTIQRETRFGDYELIEEIARGGMGVVYRARQISLARPVALKMILSGQLAAEGDISRFYAEAESAAQLSHPGIVPIFEVGQHDGQHFYAMGYIQGSSLEDRVQQGPLSCTEAAEIMRLVAESVDFAHQHGVIHRDLKPANVLLDSQGQPLVTDFGLAKRLDRDSKLTASGQVLGTPSYMPPEQASGQLDKMGPASDVYSLGAVLYALLTGRPPFQASTPVDTLLQVLERDPIPPRNLNSRVDRDLETICMKCLAKDIQQRFATARELVDEIERYQRGEPLLARPVSPWELLWRWRSRLRENRVVRVQSTGRIGRLPWVDIAVGPDTETGEERGVAKGVIAIGDTAWGVIAIGESARGIIAFGSTSIGVVAVGARAIGLACFGGLGLGLFSFAAISVGLFACGGLAVGWVAFGGVAIGQYSFGALALGKYGLGIGRRDPAAVEFFGSWLTRLFGKS